MKRAIIILSVVAVVASSSCKKQYTCVCNYGSPGPSLHQYDTTIISAANHQAAEKECSGLSNHTSYCTLSN